MKFSTFLPFLPFFKGLYDFVSHEEYFWKTVEKVEK